MNVVTWATLIEKQDAMLGNWSLKVQAAERNRRRRRKSRDDKELLNELNNLMSAGYRSCANTLESAASI